MSFEVNILGSNSAVPVGDRRPSSQLLNVNERHYLIDCGEGAQMQLMRYGLKAMKIEAIFITHYHGDHYFGLLPLLDSFMLAGRTKPLRLFAPPEIGSVMELHHSITGAADWMSFDLEFVPHPPKAGGKIFDDGNITVKGIPLEHGVPCTGFLVREHERERRMKPDKIVEYGIPYQAIKGIKQGKGFATPDGREVPNGELTEPPPLALSYAYCSDTAFSRNVAQCVKGVDVLYHEATYLDGLKAQAFERGHSTAAEAAEVARLAEAKQLILGHYSSRYKNLQPFLDEAKTVFGKVHLAREGQCYDLEKLLQNREGGVTQRG